MKLIGSLASPYVRRIRILLHELETPFEFKQIQVFSKERIEELEKYTKTRRVPILLDQDQTLWDSHLIAKYLLDKYDRLFPTIDEEKEIVLINEANDSGIVIYQLKYFDLDSEGNNAYSKLHYDRVKGILHYFDEKLKEESLKWDLVANYLYCLLDWFSYREVFPWESFKHLNNFHKSLKDKKIIQQTAP